MTILTTIKMKKMVTFKVQQITREDCIPFIMNVHYARRMPSISFAFGLFNENSLIGIVTYGQPASPSLCVGLAGKENKKNVLELNRLVINPPKDVSRNNLASFLVGRSLKKLPSNLFIVSYADVEGWQHNGYVYQASNFLYTGKTKRRTDIYSKTGHSRHHCGDKTLRQIRTSKHRYVFITGKHKNTLIKSLRYPVLPYPKDKSENYDITNPIPKDRDLNKVFHR